MSFTNTKKRFKWLGMKVTQLRVEKNLALRYFKNNTRGVILPSRIQKRDQVLMHNIGIRAFIIGSSWEYSDWRPQFVIYIQICSLLVYTSIYTIYNVYYFDISSV